MRQISLDRILNVLASCAVLLDRKQHLLAILAHANDHEQRDRRGLAIEPDAHDSAARSAKNNDACPGNVTRAQEPEVSCAGL